MTMDSSSSNEPTLLPQYGFGATYTFDVLVEHHHFLYRVHTPKHHGTLSRPSSPSPRPASPFASPHRPPLTRSPSALSTSVASIRSNDSGSSDYFAFAPSYPGDEDDTAPGDPYFLSRRFKDDLSSPDAGQRRRTLSTLSTLSGGSGTYSYMGSEDGSDAENDPAFGMKRGGLSRSASLMLGHSRTRSDSLSASRPGAKRSQSADIRQRPSPAPQKAESTEGAGMTYSDLVRHLDWTTRASSPYVTTSFSFFWCLWEAVRRYKLGVKHDVEIAVIDARKVHGRARTALEVLRGVEGERQDKAYWKWYRFALESQDVLVFGAIPGDAIYASIPLTQIMPKLPSYFFVDDVPKPIADPREPDAAVDPRSPAVQTQNPIFPSTPSRPHTPHRERDRERTFTAHLLTTLAWDVGTTLKPPRKSKDALSPSPGKPIPRHTSHAEFCKALSAAFAKRTEADQLRDATTGAVGLAELLIEPWFRARCAEGAAYPFRHDDDEESGDEKDGDADKMNDSVCLGLAGDGCALEHSHDSSIQDALFAADKDDETEEEAARREAAAILSELALSLARWPAGWWYAEHAGTVEALVGDVVSMCVTEAARGVQGRIAWGIALEGERERKRTLSGTGSVRSRVDSLSLSGSLSGSGRSERRGREATRERSRSRSPFAASSMKHVRRASEGSPSPKPWPSRESPYKPRARSPLATTPALGPAIVIRPKSKPKPEVESKSEVKPAQEQETGSSWSPSTPPPSPPLKFSLSEGNLRSVSPVRRRSPPPPPPPPRSSKRPPSPSQSISSSLASLDSPSPSPNSSPAASLSSSSLLKRSVHRRVESIPGGWPGSDGALDDRPGSPNGQQAGDNKVEEGDVFWDPTLRTQPRARPLSWASSGMALGAVSSTPSSIAGSRKSSAESLRGTAQDSPSSSPSSSMSRQRSRTQSDAQARETLLAEVVQSALGFGAGVVAGASGVTNSGSPLRLETNTSSVQPVHGSDRPLASAHHRRHSSHGHVHPLETELSPVREVEQEDEVEAEKAGLGESAESVESVGAVCCEGKNEDVEVVGAEAGPIAADELVSEPAQANTGGSPFEDKNESQSYDSVLHNASENESIALAPPVDAIPVDDQSGEQVTMLQGSGTSTPRSERQRSRSGTLASIPEEDWADWSLVEAPTASEYEAEAELRASGLESRTLESDIPLPPSPPLDPTELDDDVHIPLLGDTECSTEMKTGEDKASSIGKVAARVPEITLSVDDRKDAPGASSDQPLMKNSKSDSSLPRVSTSETSKGDTTSTLRGPLARTRAFLRTFLALPVLNLFRSATPRSATSTPSPVFEDIDTADTLLRLSPFFSFFRVPFLRSRFLRWRGQQPARSMSLILAPPSVWDAPILESDSDAPAYNATADADDSYWDAHTTSWAMSCFVCGVMATLALASVQQQRCEMHMMVGNRFH